MDFYEITEFITWSKLPLTSSNKNGRWDFIYNLLLFSEILLR